MHAQCLCGAVSLKVEHNQQVHACHCGMCRTWGSAAYFAVDAVGTPEITGTENIVRYRSSDWNERCFCKHCGTHLFCHLLPADSYSVNAGLFRDNANFVLNVQWFSDLKAPYETLADNAQKMTEAEVLAQFAG